MGEIVIFSRSKCPRCVEAKAILGQLDVPYTEINIEDDLRNSMLMSRVSGQHTVPQIFFNDRHIGGAREFKNIVSEDIQTMADAALREAGRPAFLSMQYTDEELESAVIPIKDIIDPHIPEDPTAIPEYEAVRIWYGGMFGFLCNLYDQMILKPESTALWIAVLASAMEVVEKRIGAHFGTACFSTAIKAGCSYCSAHGADLSLKYAAEAPENIKLLDDYLRHNKGTLDELPFSDELKVVINLAAKMTDHSVTLADIRHASSVYGDQGLREACYSVGGMGIIMGFLNRFNDLIGVEIEASIKQSIDNSVIGANWHWGTHDTGDDANRYQIREEAETQAMPDDIDLRGLIINVKKQVLAEVEPLLSRYIAFPQEQLPAWIAGLPDQDCIQTVSALYHSLFNSGDVDIKLKHLAAYALAVGSGYAGIAEEEARIIRFMNADSSESAYKLNLAYAFARSGDPEHIINLDPAERLALRLAKCSDNFPHTVRGALVKELAQVFSAVQIIELVMALAVIGIGQRWLGIIEPLSAYMLTNEFIVTDMGG